MDATTITVVVSLVAVVIAGYSIYKTHQKGEPITGELLQGELKVAVSQAQELVTVAETAVKNAEQLYRSGEITKDERYSEAVEYIRQWFPGLDEDVLKANLEAAVLVVNTLTRTLPQLSERSTK